MNKDEFFKQIAEMKFLAKKEVGQNFLIDSEAAERIVTNLNIQSNDTVLEIGCGAGSLSYFLSLYENEIDLIDIDEGLLVKVQEDFKNAANLHPFKGNAMDYDYSKYTKIVGNLPYYITSGIIENVLLGANKCERAVFMVQKEAATRLMAPVGSDDCTPLTLFLSYLCKVSRLFNVGRNSFTPIPHVDSTVLGLNFIKERYNKETLEAYQLAKKLFLNKRKTILNNLKNVYKANLPFDNILQRSGINPTQRPQTISFEKFIILYRELNTK